MRTVCLMFLAVPLIGSSITLLPGESTTSYWKTDREVDWVGVFVVAEESAAGSTLDVQIEGTSIGLVLYSGLQSWLDAEGNAVTRRIAAGSVSIPASTNNWALLLANPSSAASSVLVHDISVGVSWLEGSAVVSKGAMVTNPEPSTLMTLGSAMLIYIGYQGFRRRRQNNIPRVKIGDCEQVKTLSRVGRDRTGVGTADACDYDAARIR